MAHILEAKIRSIGDGQDGRVGRGGAKARFQAKENQLREEANEILRAMMEERELK